MANLSFAQKRAAAVKHALVMLYGISRQPFAKPRQGWKATIGDIILRTASPEQGGVFKKI